ncbi:serine/threonine protein kinase [Allocatelliglobosispora scoriae]|uniref:Serine/threonine protein kinase n=1 Tax=Allocatelliglobosispora scoriae TaxID=643052 RepID=A0A841BTK2_9ACTN|nr:serine/threonine protein kinase [Allocatelliglobosispora scoriae]
MADPLFYDTLYAATAEKSAFAVDSRDTPAGWERRDQDDWLVYAPTDLDLPLQGWKIHVSATLENADRVLEAIWDYCIPRGIEFKFLRSMQVLWLRSSKYAHRGYSGKLVTIYPPDEATCEKILVELGDLLEGEQGPYILSDLRWGSGPLYVRYGGFAFQYCVTESGQVVPGIADDTGQLVPDRRDPVFYIPPWVTVPDFLAPHLAARNAVTVTDIPYRIDSVLHFSNGGGVYRGSDTRTGAEVVLKEGRPFAGLDGANTDAVARLDIEFEMLRRLAGVPGVPVAHDLFTVGDHRFMAMEFVDGRPLYRAIVRQYPMIDFAAGPAEFADYTAWALDVYGQVEAAILAMHERGVVYGDLHLYNILIRPDDTIALLDYEVASPVENLKRPALGNQGFTAPRGTTGFDLDLYALACLRLALFFPITQLFWLSREKAAHFSAIIAEHFPVPPDYLEKAVSVIAPDATVPADEPDWTELRDGMVKAITASATPDREDRLFPGDIEQFRTGGGLGLAYGAAGVLYALDVTGAGRFPEWEQWLLDRAKDPKSGSMLGLYDGMHGVAFTLEHLGHRQEALNLLDMCLSDDWAQLNSELLGGLAGIGLNLQYFADRTGDAALAQAAQRAAELVAERLGDEMSVPETSGGDNPYAGLMRGSSGPAWLLMRAYDRTGDPAFLDSAAVALRQDLRRCILRDNGTLEVNESWRSLPYLAMGSVGVGLALDDYLARRHDDQFTLASAQIRGAALLRFYVQPGVFGGRAGMLLYLAARASRPSEDPEILAQLRALSWHRLSYQGGIAFPGDALMRLSMDVATGTAGVLLATGSVLSGPMHLPLLAPHLTDPPRRPA